MIPDRLTDGRRDASLANRVGAVCFVGMLVLVAVTPGATPVAADETTSTGDTVLDQLFDEEEAGNQTDDGLLGNLTASVSRANLYFSGLVANTKYGVGASDEPRTAASCAEDIQTELNSNNQTYETYVNNRINASTDRNVVKVTCKYEADGGLLDETMETESVYVVADVTNGSYSNMTVVDSTNRSVDERVVLTGLAVQQLPDDLKAFTDDYAAKGKTPGKGYERMMAAKYAGHVEGTFAFLPAIENETDSEVSSDG